MQKIENYKGCSLDARAHERRDCAGWMAEVYLTQPEGSADRVTQFTFKETFLSAEAAIQAALQTGRRKVDVGFELEDIM